MMSLRGLPPLCRVLTRPTMNLRIVASPRNFVGLPQCRFGLLTVTCPTWRQTVRVDRFRIADQPGYRAVAIVEPRTWVSAKKC